METRPGVSKDSRVRCEGRASVHTGVNKGIVYACYHRSQHYAFMLPDTQRLNTTYACIQISVEYDGTYRSPGGPVFHRVHLKYVKAPRNVAEASGVQEAIKTTVERLVGAYDTYDSFEAVSPAFQIDTNVNDVAALELDVQTPEKSSPHANLEFCQNLINVLASNDMYENFKAARPVHTPFEEPPRLDFTGL